MLPIGEGVLRGGVGAPSAAADTWQTGEKVVLDGEVRLRCVPKGAPLHACTINPAVNELVRALLVFGSVNHKPRPELAPAVAAAPTAAYVRLVNNADDGVPPHKCSSLQPQLRPDIDRVHQFELLCVVPGKSKLIIDNGAAGILRATCEEAHAQPEAPGYATAAKWRYIETGC